MRKLNIEAIVEQHYKGVFGFALSLTRNETEAADLTQQAFLLLSQNIDKIRNPDKIKSWLYTCLRREFYKMHRERVRFTSIDSDDSGFDHLESIDSVETQVLKQADSQMVMEGLAAMEEIFSQPLTLFYFEDFSYREIAEILNIPEGTVMSRLARGRNKLRNWLNERIGSAAQADNVIAIPTTGNEPEENEPINKHADIK